MRVLVRVAGIRPLEKGDSEVASVRLLENRINLEAKSKSQFLSLEHKVKEQIASEFWRK